MENESIQVLCVADKDEENRRSEATESTHSKSHVEESTLVPCSPENNAHAGKDDWKNGDVDDVGTAGEVNMEASITPDEVVRAGGFGARDDIGSFLPVASDSTDFEASILDAKDYEEPQELGEPSRHGLGWREAQKTE
ncbi:hypothetical protein SLE2022_062100 [Rubroshorea leprosula]